jgi:hypothetical protein
MVHNVHHYQVHTNVRARQEVIEHRLDVNVVGAYHSIPELAARPRHNLGRCHAGTARSDKQERILGKNGCGLPEKSSRRRVAPNSDSSTWKNEGISIVA